MSLFADYIAQSNNGFVIETDTSFVHLMSHNDTLYIKNIYAPNKYDFVKAWRRVIHISKIYGGNKYKRLAGTIFYSNPQYTQLLEMMKKHEWTIAHIDEYCMTLEKRIN